VAKDNNEIDLLQFLVKILKTFRANLLLVIVCFIIGCLLGIAHFSTARKVYESKMIISSSILTGEYSKVLFESVNKHLSEGNYEMLSKQFNVPEKVMRSLGSVESASLSETNDIKMKDRLLITAELYDYDDLVPLQQGLIYYLENNEFAKVRVEQAKNFFKQMIASVDLEIKDMEQLKARIANGEFFQATKGNVMFDPTTVNSKIIDLTERKIDYENKLQLSNSVQVIEGFTRFQRRTLPRLSYSVGTGAIAGFLIATVIILSKGLITLVKEDES